MNFSRWLLSTGKYIGERCGGAGRVDAEAILGHVTGRNRASLYRDGDMEISPEMLGILRDLAERRAGGEPLAYITGRKEFYGLDFMVTPTVLIPRPETELLVEKALECYEYHRGETPVVVDVGTGSGAIAVSLAVLLDLAVVYATDISTGALEVARKNAACLGVGRRVFFLQGDLLEPLHGIVQPGRVGVMAANLPYVPSDELPGLMAGVRDFEPRLALDGGADGLDLYRRLVPEARKMLISGGFLLMEIAPGQGRTMIRMLQDGWQVKIFEDLAGRERLVVARCC